MRPGCTSKGPFSGIAEDRARRARGSGSARGSGRAASRPGTRSTARSFVGVERDRLRGQLGRRPPTSTIVSLLAGDDVRVGDDDARARPPSPEPSIASPQAVPRTRTTLRAAALTAGVRSDPAWGAATSGAGPVIVRQRIESRERVQDRARRRQQLRSARAGSPSAGCRRAGALSPGVCATTAARIHTTPSPTATLSSGAEQAVEQAETRDDEHAAQLEADALEARSRGSRPRAARRSGRTPARRARRSPADSSSGPRRVPRNAPSGEAAEGEHARR